MDTLHDTSIQHAAQIAALRARGVRAIPLILKINHELFPDTRVRTLGARVNGTVLKIRITPYFF